MPARRPRSAFGEHLHFLGRFLRNPRHVGSVAPSSPALARQMVRDVPFRAGARIVELGPGTGAFTREVMRRLVPGAHFLAVDIDRGFCDELAARWPDLDLVCGSATELGDLLRARGWPGADHVLSGLPFASLPAALTRAILTAVHESLVLGGAFTTFQYVHAFGLPPAVRFREQMDAAFGPLTERRLVLANLPPAYVISWTKTK